MKNKESLLTRMFINKNLTLFIIVFVILLSFWFYWFELRIEHIRNYCLKTSTEDKQRTINPLLEKYNKYSNNLYRACLIDNGLKPENLTSE